MKHPKDRGDRRRRNFQHKELRQNPLFRMKVEEDKRLKHALKIVEDDEWTDFEEAHDDH